MKKIFIIFLTIIMILVLGSSAIIYISQKNLLMKKQAFDNKLKQVDMAHHLGNLNESIKEYKVLIAEAPDQESIYRAQVHLRFDLFSRNQGDDRIEAVKIYKEMATEKN